MWTDKNRAKYDRDHLRYPSDLTDDEWACVEPLIPPARRGGGKRRTEMRAVMDGVMYILSTGCQWRYIPKDFPPRSTLHDYFTWWHLRRHAGSDPSCTLRRMPREGGTRGQPYCLRHRQPEREERRKRGASIDPHGFDAGKLIKGKKRHILVDMQGLLLHAIVHSAGVQDRDGGIWLLATLFGQFPFLAKLFADSAYAGTNFRYRAQQSSAQPQNRNRQTLRSCQRVRAVTKALDRRTYHRLVEPLPPTGQGLGKSQSQRSRFPQTRFHPPHVTKAMQSLIKTSDGL